MKPDHELLKRLTAADRRLRQAQLRPGATQEIAGRISREIGRPQSPPSRRWIPMLTFVAGAVMVLLFLRGVSAPSRSDSAAPTTAQHAVLPTVAVSGADCRSQTDGTTVARGSCRLVSTSPSMSVDTLEGAHLSMVGKDVRLHEGSALFDVDKVIGSPVRVLVPTGEIRVIGTRFRVLVSGQSSQVDLYEGRLEFHSNNGVVTPIVAGQRKEFGVPAPSAAVRAAPAPDVAAEIQSPSSPTPRSATRSTPRQRAARRRAPKTAGPLIEAVEQLRREGQYADAAALLREALRKRWPRRTADVLSYELGRLLARQLGDRGKACAHWERHLSRYKTTRYRKQIERSAQRLGCASVP